MAPHLITTLNNLKRLKHSTTTKLIRIEKKQFILLGVAIDYRVCRWIEPSGVELEAILRTTYSSVLQLINNGNLLEARKKDSLQGLWNLVHSVERVQHRSPIKHVDGGAKESRELQQITSLCTKLLGSKTDHTAGWSMQHGHIPDRFSDEANILQALQTFEGIQSDYFYELFELWRPRGELWYSKEILHDLELLESLKQTGEEQPYQRWKREHVQRAAQLMKHGVEHVYKDFWSYYRNSYHKTTVANMSKGMVALLLASQYDLLEHEKKNCHHYFTDFLHFYTATCDEQPPHGLLRNAFARLRNALSDQMYSMMLPINKHLHIFEQYLPNYHDICTTHGLWKVKMALKNGVQEHLYGPVMQVRELIEYGMLPGGFDPLALGHLPHGLFQIKTDTICCHVCALPSPTTQTHVQSAKLHPMFIHAVGRSHEKGEQSLYVQTQNPHAWLDLARCAAIRNFVGNEKVLVASAHLKNSEEDFQATEVWQQRMVDEGFTPAMVTTVMGRFPTALSRQNQHWVWYDLLCLHRILMHLDTTSHNLYIISKDGVDTSFPVLAGLPIVLAKVSGQLDAKQLHDYLLHTLFALPIALRDRFMHEDIFSRIYNLVQILERASKKEVECLLGEKEHWRNLELQFYQDLW